MIAMRMARLKWGRLSLLPSSAPSGFAVAVLSVLLGAVPAQAGSSSVYTKLDFENDCLALSTYEAGGTWACSGYKGYPILYSEGDLRTSLFFGHLGPWFKGTEGNFAFASFGAFNSVGDTVEWRLDSEGVPFATILRWRTDSGNPDEAKGNVLVVSKVAQPGDGIGCIAGYVDAVTTTDANTVARMVADTIVPGFDCRTAEPQWHGGGGDHPATMVYYPGNEPGE